MEVAAPLSAKAYGGPTVSPPEASSGAGPARASRPCAPATTATSTRARNPRASTAARAGHACRSPRASGLLPASHARAAAKRQSASRLCEAGVAESGNALDLAGVAGLGGF